MRIVQFLISSIYTEALIYLYPVCPITAGVIMLHLGFDLVNDSLIASRRALDSLEYSSILFVGSVVTVFGFVPGNDDAHCFQAVVNNVELSNNCMYRNRCRRSVGVCDICGAEQPRFKCARSFLW